MKAIVTGMIASYPVGGVFWDYAQYALGLEQLGFEVYYLEDTGWQTYDPGQACYTDDPTYGVHFLRDSLATLSPTLKRRWHFRGMDGSTHGISAEELRDVAADAELFLNVSGGTLLRDEYLSCRRKVLIDTDPGWNHFRNYPRWDAEPQWQGSHGYRAHDHFFTYAECQGKPGCILPDLGLPWQPTRPPVVTGCWTAEGPGETWTTVMTWKNFQETIRWGDLTFATKEAEFHHVERLPSLTDSRLEIAIGGAEAPEQQWRDQGWSVVPASQISATSEAYRSYIQQSRGEVSVAKNVYVATGSGWFSCRSVCYLAAGRPVILQDTGFSRVIPTGCGLLSFSNQEEAARALRQVEADYDAHQAAARDVALTYFDARVVLSTLLERVGLG